MTTPTDVAALPNILATITHDLDYHVGLIEGSANGEFIFAETGFMSANVWAWLIYIWPRVVLIPGLLILILILRRIIRVARNPQQRGDPYCRKCGYALVGSPTDKCPECGVSIADKQPRIGRSQPRRLLIPLTLFAGIVAGLIYSNLALPDLPKSVRSWFHWPSRSLAISIVDKTNEFWTFLTPVTGEPDWLWSHEEIWSIRISDGRKVTSFDTATPKTLSDLSMMSPSMDWYTYDMKVSPDDQTILIRRGESVAVFDTAEDEPKHILRPEDGSSQGMRHDMESECVAVSSDGTEVYTSNAFNEVFGWRVADGVALANPGIEVVRFKSAPTNPDDQPFYHVWDTASGRKRLFVFSGLPVNQRSAAISADGKRMYLQNHPDQHVEVIDINSRARLKTFNAPSNATFSMDSLAVSPDEKFAAVGGYEGVWQKVFLRDLTTDQWIAKLDVPVNTVYRIMFTKDGRHVIVHGMTPSPAAMNQTATLLIFNLKSVLTRVAQ